MIESGRPNHVPSAKTDVGDGRQCIATRDAVAGQDYVGAREVRAAAPLGATT